MPKSPNGPQEMMMIGGQGDIHSESTTTRREIPGGTPAAQGLTPPAFSNPPSLLHPNGWLIQGLQLVLLVLAAVRQLIKCEAEAN